MASLSFPLSYVGQIKHRCMELGHAIETDLARLQSSDNDREPLRQRIAKCLDERMALLTQLQSKEHLYQKPINEMLIQQKEYNEQFSHVFLPLKEPVKVTQPLHSLRDIIPLSFTFLASNDLKATKATCAYWRSMTRLSCGMVKRHYDQVLRNLPESPLLNDFQQFRLSRRPADPSLFMTLPRFLPLDDIYKPESFCEFLYEDLPARDDCFALHPVHEGLTFEFLHFCRARQLETQQMLELSRSCPLFEKGNEMAEKIIHIQNILSENSESIEAVAWLAEFFINNESLGALLAIMIEKKEFRKLLANTSLYLLRIGQDAHALNALQASLIAHPRYPAPSNNERGAIICYVVKTLLLNQFEKQAFQIAHGLLDDSQQTAFTAISDHWRTQCSHQGSQLAQRLEDPTLPPSIKERLKHDYNAFLNFAAEISTPRMQKLITQLENSPVSMDDLLGNNPLLNQIIEKLLPEFPEAQSWTNIYLIGRWLGVPMRQGCWSIWTQPLRVLGIYFFNQEKASVWRPTIPVSSPASVFISGPEGNDHSPYAVSFRVAARIRSLLQDGNIQEAKGLLSEIPLLPYRLGCEHRIEAFIRTGTLPDPDREITLSSRFW